MAGRPYKAYCGRPRRPLDGGPLIHSHLIMNVIPSSGAINAIGEECDKSTYSPDV
jgi:hypothetical protein